MRIPVFTEKTSRNTLVWTRDYPEFESGVNAINQPVLINFRVLHRLRETSAPFSVDNNVENYSTSESLSQAITLDLACKYTFVITFPRQKGGEKGFIVENHLPSAKKITSRVWKTLLT